MKNQLLLPWNEGFWEYYHSKPPIGWQQKMADQGTIYLAPDPLTGALNLVSCLEEYYERESETQEWIENSSENPFADPFADWYPFKEFDQVESEEQELVI